MTKQKPLKPESVAEPPTQDDALLFVDAIEGDFAHLLLGETPFDVPARLLPEGAKEGTWLRILMVVTPDRPDDGGVLRNRLGGHDGGGNIKL